MRPSYRLAAFLFRALFRFSYRLTVVGGRSIPLDRPLILASNHQSNLDPPLIGAFFPGEISFVAKKQLFARRWMAWIIGHFNAIPLDRTGIDLRALREIRARLEQGRHLLVFPEGTRSRDGRLGRPRSGLGMIIAGADADVLPVLILGTRRRLGFPGHRSALRLEFGQVIPRNRLPLEESADDLAPSAALSGAGLEREGQRRPARAERITQAVFQQVEALHHRASS